MNRTALLALMIIVGCEDSDPFLKQARLHPGTEVCGNAGPMYGNKEIGEGDEFCVVYKNRINPAAVKGDE